MSEPTRVGDTADQMFPAGAAGAPDLVAEEVMEGYSDLVEDQVQERDDVEPVDPFEALRAELARDVGKPNVFLKVPSRPGVSVEFSPTMTADQRKQWQKTSTKRSRRPGEEGEMDDMKFACLVIAHLCRGIRIGGDTARDPQGRALTFASGQVWGMLKPPATNPQDAIRRFYGNDAHVALVAGELVLRSGFEDDVEEDPTAAAS